MTSSMSSRVTLSGSRRFQLPALSDDLEVFLFHVLFEPVARGFFEFLRRNGIFDPAVDYADPPLNIDHLFRDGGRPQFYPCSRFIDQINGFVRQKPVRNIAIGKVDRSLQALRPCI